MEPSVLEALIPFAGMLVGVIAICVVVGIPLLGLTARFAAKPLVDALIRWQEVQRGQGASSETLALQDRRISLLEAEIQQLQSTLQQLTDAEDFRQRLGAAREPARLGEGPRAPGGPGAG